MRTMKPSTISLTAKTKYYCTAGAVLLIALAVAGLFVGKYPLSMEKLLAGDDMQWQGAETLPYRWNAKTIIKTQKTVDKTQLCVV